MAHDPDLLAQAARLPLLKRDLVCHIAPLNLRAQIASAGHERRRGGDGYDWHGLRRGPARFVCIQHTLAGEGRLRWGGEIHALVPGTAMLVCIPHDHRYWLPAGASWEFIWACLVGNDIHHAVLAMQERFGPVVPLAAEAPALAALVRAVQAVVTDPGPGPYRASALAYDLAMALAETAAEAAAPDADAGLRAAEAFCREHRDREVSVAELAAIAGMSRHHFTRRFQAIHGAAPKAYHTALRIQHAAELLRAHGTVKDVARACGFTDPTYFCKVFRRHVGLSPGAFRDGGMFLGDGRAQPLQAT